MYIPRHACVCEFVYSQTLSPLHTTNKLAAAFNTTEAKGPILSRVRADLVQLYDHSRALNSSTNMHTGIATQLLHGIVEFIACFCVPVCQCRQTLRLQVLVYQQYLVWGPRYLLSGAAWSPREQCLRQPVCSPKGSAHCLNLSCSAWEQANTLSLSLQIARGRSCLCTLGRNVGITNILRPLGFVLR